jgi:hypothetical protein
MARRPKFGISGTHLLFVIEHQAQSLGVREGFAERRRPESNRCKRLCRPLRSHSATSPGTSRVSVR